MIKKFVVVLIVLAASVTAKGQGWGYLPSGSSTSLIAYPMPPENGQYRFKLVAAVTDGELAQVQLYRIIDGDFNAGYKLFLGDWQPNQPPADTTYYHIEFGWPPAAACNYDHGGQDPDRRKYWWYVYYNPGCEPESAGTNIDTSRWVNGFGYWKVGPSLGNYPQMNGYIKMHFSAEICRWFPKPYIPIASAKNYINVTDSTYAILYNSENAVLSGNSRVYVAARTFQGDSVFARFSLQSHAGSERRIKLTYKGTQYEYDDWQGYLENTKDMGLKSYDVLKVKMEAFYKHPETNDTITAPVKVNVCLPNVNIDPDTVIIDHDLMKIGEDVSAYIEIKDDNTHQKIAAEGVVDSVGYRYRSRWTANANLAPANRQLYKHVFPRNSSFIWRRVNFPPGFGCSVLFKRDSLAAVGGELSIDAIGDLNPIPWMLFDNGFKVTTDTMAGNDTIRTHKILIDSDPSNAEFSARLASDRIRAIAWKEYAGSEDTTHCHNPYNPRWNHYWDDRISGRDTCRDTHTPCENASGYDTGIMQIYRHPDWEPWFARAGNPPAGYMVVKWDSLAWNWKVCIDNGIYIHNTYMPYKFISEQRLFPDSCSLADCDTFPTHKNKVIFPRFDGHGDKVYLRKQEVSVWEQDATMTGSSSLKLCGW